MTDCYLDRAGMSSSNPPRNWEAFRFVWAWRLSRRERLRQGGLKGLLREAMELWGGHITEERRRTLVCRPSA